VALAEEVIATFTDLAASRRVHILLNQSESDFRRSLTNLDSRFVIAREQNFTKVFRRVTSLKL